MRDILEATKRLKARIYAGMLGLLLHFANERDCSL